MEIFSSTETIVMGKLPLGEIVIWENVHLGSCLWEIVTWEVALGKLPINTVLSCSLPVCVRHVNGR